MASCADTVQFGGFLALQNMLGATSPPHIISISYGESEADNGASENAYIANLYETAVMEGVSIFVSSGDQGAASSDYNQVAAEHGITVSGFTTTPYNVSVGGTDFADQAPNGYLVNTYFGSTNNVLYGNALSYIPEIPWNESCAGSVISGYNGKPVFGSTSLCNNGGYNFIIAGSGGPSNCATGATAVGGVSNGTCAGWPKPGWQKVYGNPSDGVRDTPDVALFASNGYWGSYYIVCFSDPNNGGKSCTGDPSTWAGFGGTSVSSPIMAGIQALINQRTASNWGNPNPTLYSLASTEYGASGNSSCNSTNGNTIGSTCLFYDITQGDITVGCLPNSGILYNCYLPGGTYGVLSTSNSAYEPAFAATPGWDFATGLGSVNAFNLVMGWPSGAPAVSTTSGE
jgi:subtilase family serine protease